MNVGDYDKSLAEYNEVLKLTPNDPEIIYEVGNIYLKKEIFEEALKKFNEAISLEPNNKNYRYGRGVTLLKMGDPDEALREYGQALDLREKDAMSDIDQILGSAIREYQQTVKVNPNDPTAQADMGYVLARSGKLNDAIKAYRKAIALDPTNADYHRDLAAILWEKGEEEDALKEIETAIIAAPGDPVLRALHADYLKTSSPSKAVEELRFAIDKDKDNVDYRVKLADLLIYMEKNDDALAELDAASLMAPTEPKIRYSKAKILMSISRYDEAAKELSDAVRFDPYNIEYYNALSSSLLQINDLEGASKASSRSVELDPSNPEYHFDLGYVYYVMGRDVEALKEFNESIRYNYHKSRCYYLRGLVLDYLNESG
ncbi:TPR Domain containing protein, partial [mine drainage metagenome]